MRDDNKHERKKVGIFGGVVSCTLAFIGFGSLLVSVMEFMRSDINFQMEHRFTSGVFALAAAVSLGLLLNAFVRD